MICKRAAHDEDFVLQSGTGVGVAFKKGHWGPFLGEKATGSGCLVSTATPVPLQYIWAFVPYPILAVSLLTGKIASYPAYTPSNTESQLAVSA